MFRAGRGFSVGDHVTCSDQSHRHEPYRSGCRHFVAGRDEPVLDIPPQLGDFGIGTIRLDETELLVAIADSNPNRALGLMNVADLGSLDGMVFVWPEDTDGTFWMRDTGIPLDIAWFDGEGRFISQLVMAPCEPFGACPHFAADRLHRYALEMPEGTMPSLSADSRLDLVDGF